jgi:GDP-L-fucose synthase
MDQGSRIYVAGHNGLVGSAICRILENRGFTNLIKRSHSELELSDQLAVRHFFAEERPEYVFLSAAKVGGIHANLTYPADFIRDNLLVQANVIDAAYLNGTRKLLFLGSSCIYPKFSPQPIKEEYLLTSELEPTNEWYAIAKIAGIKMCQAYRRQYGFNAISVMPTNLYGPGDNFNLENSHVVPAMLRKFHEAKQSGQETVDIWGTGNPRREFMHVDDMADAALFLMEQYDNEAIINVGVGVDVTIRELAEVIAEVVDFGGRLRFDASKPDGAPRKLLDVSRLNALGWKAKIPLFEGLASTYDWFLQSESLLRR